LTQSFTGLRDDKKGEGGYQGELKRGRPARSRATNGTVDEVSDLLCGPYSHWLDVKAVAIDD